MQNYVKKISKKVIHYTSTQVTFWFVFVQMFFWVCVYVRVCTPIYLCCFFVLSCLTKKWAHVIHRTL